MARFDARGWVAGLLGMDPGEVAVRSVDHYGESETQVRYENQGVAVVRLTVTGPVRPFMTAEGHGRWELRASIGSGTQDVHTMELPETDEIDFG